MLKRELANSYIVYDDDDDDAHIEPVYFITIPCVFIIYKNTCSYYIYYMYIFIISNITTTTTTKYIKMHITL